MEFIAYEVSIWEDKKFQRWMWLYLHNNMIIFNIDELYT